MDDLGRRLKRAREERGVSLREIATRTKISLTALEALERNEFHRLPGGIFSRSVVRAYALEVGIDPDTTVDDFLAHAAEAEREAAERAAATRPPVTRDDREFLDRQRRAVRFLRLGIAVAAVLIVTVAIWQARRWMARSEAADAAAPVSTVTIAPPPAPEPPPAALPETASATGTGTPPVVPPATPPVTAGPPPAAPAPTSTARIVLELTATAECRIEIERDGQPVEMQTLRSGQRYRVEADRLVVLNVSDAGALQWLLNSRPAKPLGRPGAGVRVRITPDNAAEFQQ